MTIWIVCQQTEGQKPLKVGAFTDKGLASGDAADRMTKAPVAVSFWLESVEMSETSEAIVTAQLAQPKAVSTAEEVTAP